MEVSRTPEGGENISQSARTIPRRSSQENLGIPPIRYGEWEPQPRSEAVIPPPIFQSTTTALDGTALTRTTVAPPRDDDTMSVSSHSSRVSIRSETRSLRMEDNKAEIARLEEESQQLESAMKQRIIRMQNQMHLLKLENSVLEQQQQLEEENDVLFDDEREERVNEEEKVNQCISSVVPDSGHVRYIPTPRRPSIPPPPPPVFGFHRKLDEKKNIWPHHPVNAPLPPPVLKKEDLGKVVIKPVESKWKDDKAPPVPLKIDEMKQEAAPIVVPDGGKETNQSSNSVAATPVSELLRIMKKEDRSASDGCVEGCVPWGAIPPESQFSSIARVDVKNAAKDFTD
ncbi:unnamed protein product [Orchesella dallaii]|uniref:Uncharacterized protein n=1 Tax=Orchesella dallaii TaxID=48710 RepID=A0ABP1RK79_9HEXA